MARPASSYDYLFKLLLLGDSGVGKSCILLRYAEDSFTTSFITTIGIDFKIKTIDVMDWKCKLQVWDTAGQERFRTVTTAYIRGAESIIIVYDVTDEQSFLNVRNWVRMIQQKVQHCNMVFIGNKADMEEDRVITKSRGEELADEYGVQFFETSSKNDTFINECFDAVIQDLLPMKIQGSGVDYLVKILVIGEVKVGKSCIVNRFIDKETHPYLDDYAPTIGTDWRFNTIDVDESTCKVKIEDASGKDDLPPGVSYVRSGHVIIIVYDVTNEESFSKVQKWMKLVQDRAANIQMVLLANKIDCDEQRVVTEQAGQTLAAEIGASYYEVSAKTNTNISECFHDVVKKTIPFLQNESERTKVVNKQKPKRTNLRPQLQPLEISPVKMRKASFYSDSRNSAIYSLVKVKRKRQFRLNRFVGSIVKILLFPFALSLQLWYFHRYKKRKIISKSFLPDDFDVYAAKSRVYSDFLSPMFRSTNDVYDLEKALGAGSFAEQSNKQLWSRLLVTIIAFIAYSFMWISYAIFMNDSDRCSVAECVVPVIIYMLLMFSISLWIAFECNVLSSFSSVNIATNPMHFHYDHGKKRDDAQDITTNTGTFLSAISNQIKAKQKYKKSMNLFFALASVFYAFLPSIARLSRNDRFILADTGVWFMCFVNNSILIYVCLGLCKMTTTAAFGDVLELMGAITDILNQTLTTRRFNQSNIFLPYLDLRKKHNLVSWIQLRSYLYIEGLSSMINVEIWMVTFISIQIPLVGYCLYLFIHNEGDVFGDAIFLICLYIVVIGGLYICIVAWIGTRFAVLHRDQMRELMAQSTFIDHICLEMDHEEAKYDEEQESSVQMHQYERIVRSIKHCVKYMEGNDITPRLFSIRLDKMLWKSLIGILFSIVGSGLALYVQNVW
eukprot:463882_1